jgi:MYXO-CTERM domain-containing protein
MTGGRLAIAAALVLLPLEASAFVCTLNESSPFVSIHWNERRIRYAIRAPGATSISSAETLALVQRSFEVWEQPRCSDLTFVYDGVVDPSTEPRAVSQVIFQQVGWVEGSRSSAAVALTTMTYAVSDGVIKFGILEVNEEIYRFSDAADGCEQPDTYDLGAVLTHEVGHFIGLAHTDLPPESDFRAPTMTAMVNQCDPEFRSLETDDIEGLCFIYPDGAPTRQCATLPAQEEPYLQSVPFGCSATSRPDASDGLLLAAVGLFVSLRRRRTCD